jgi:L-methionine (R)-S-oxide reductase
MNESIVIDKELSDEEIYKSLIPQLDVLINQEEYLLSNLSNFTAAIKQTFDKISWIGFYFFDGRELILGPFQGKVACSKIGVGIGVCGFTFRERKTTIVPDVNKFSGHIACDSESKSEIVIPLIKNEKMIGVLDLDSYLYNSFNEKDKKYLEKICNLLLEKLPLENFKIS